MHEMSIAQNIIEIIRQYVPHDAETKVRNVHLKIGETSGILIDSLAFCYRAITQNSSLQESILVIDRIPLSIQCHACHALTTSDAIVFYCQACGSNNVSMLSGMEMLVTDIEVEENQETKL